MNFDQPPRNPEEEPTTYQDVLDAFIALRASGITNLGETFDPDTNEDADPAVQAAFDLKDKWESQPVAGDVEEAKKIVQAKRLFIDAGYASPEEIQDAILGLNDEYVFMLGKRGGADDEAAEIVRAAVDSLIENPSEKIETVIQEILQKAKSAERKDIIDAVRQIAATIAPNNPDFRSFFKTEEGKKKLAYMKRIEPVVDRIYQDMLTKNPSPMDPRTLDSIEK